MVDVEGEAERLDDTEAVVVDDDVTEFVIEFDAVLLCDGAEVMLGLNELDADADGERDGLAELEGVHDGVCDVVAGRVRLCDTVPEFR